MNKAGDEKGRREQQQFGSGGRIVGADVLLLEIDAGHFA